MNIKKILLSLSILLILQLNNVIGATCGGNITCNCGDTVSSNYILTENMYCENNGLFLKNKVELDCRGHILKGNSKNIGILVLGYKNIIIKNCQIMNFSTGILLGTHKINTGNGWGSNWVETIYSYDTQILNNKFENLNIGIEASSSYRDFVINNSFKNINDYSIRTGSKETNIWRNRFDSSKNIEYSISSNKKFCEGEVENIYLNQSKGPTCSCHIPNENILYNSKINFCEGTYHLPNGIQLADKAKINCIGTHIIGNGQGIGIKVEGARETSINNCTISNYTTGISYYQKYVKKGFDKYYLTSFNNEVHNSTIYDVDYGIKTQSGYRERPNLAEKIDFNTILAREYSIYNPTSQKINAENNYWGSNNHTQIESKFISPELISYLPYEKRNSTTDFSINKEDFKYELKSGKLKFSILKDNYIDEPNEIEIELLQIRNETLIMNNTFLINNKNGPRLKINLNLSLKENDEILIFVNPNNNYKEINFRNNFLKIKIKEQKKYSIKINSGYNILDEEIRKYLKKLLQIEEFVSEEKSNFIITVEKSNDIIFENPYKSSIISKKEKNLTKIEIKGSDIEGLLAAIKLYSKNKIYLENNEYEIKQKNSDIISLKIYDYLNNLITYKENSNKFRKKIKEILYDSTYEQIQYYIPIKTPNSTTQYNLIKFEPRYSNELLNYINMNQTPTVFAGGLWSNIKTWNELGQELANEGRKIYLIEITGGENSECENCYDYPYEFLTEEVFPTYINFILNNSNSTKVNYVGHSNGARVAIDSLSKHKINFPKIETLISVGVPGAFEEKSLFSKIILKIGNKTNSNNLENKHLSISNLISFNFLDLNNKNKISKNLWLTYYNWIESTKEKQPGENLTLNRFILISGDYKNTRNDLIVPIKDGGKIFENIISKNKSLHLGNYPHMRMSEEENIKTLIKKELN